MTTPEQATVGAPSSRQRTAVLTLAALGVVYGDIGTSPLYALRECFHGPHAMEPSSANVLGVLSLIFWSLIFVISIKYIVFIMRADNRGEGGVLALMALALRKGKSDERKLRPVLVVLGIFGAALLYGDGIITPAVSVLGAVEGLAVSSEPFVGVDPVAEAFHPWVVPISLVILAGLFLLQRRGTGGVGVIFGPIMCVWFIVIAFTGTLQLVQDPSVFRAIWPGYAVTFFAQNGWHGILVLGAVFLVVTGGEALYADMGHFGRTPIRIAWGAVVLPCLLLNYFGQGALLLRDPTAARNPFFLLAPGNMRMGLVAISVFAAVVASQALISGAFSMTRQAVQLGYWPRMEVVHTSAEESGQIYMPGLNTALFVGVVVLVLTFRSSSALAAAYGIAVTATMTITTVLAYVVARDQWGVKRWLALLLASIALTIDLAFFGANAVKIADGGWFPLVLGAVIFVLMTTWKRGREILATRLRETSLSVTDLLQSFEHHPPIRVPGVAIFMTGNPEGAPMALMHNLKHNKVLHENTVLLTVINEDFPYVPPEERVEVSPLDLGLSRIIARYGFMESPTIADILKRAREKGLVFNLMSTSFFLGRETLIPSKKPGMALWREGVFAWMTKNARSATAFFRIPPNRVVEMGSQIEL